MDIAHYKISHQEVLNVIRPQLEFFPNVETNYYLFGCTRHNNLHYIKNRIFFMIKMFLDKDV